MDGTCSCMCGHTGNWGIWRSVLELYITAHLTPSLIGFVAFQGVLSCWGDDCFVRVGFGDKRRPKVRFCHYNIELFLDYFGFIKITLGAHVPFDVLKVCWIVPFSWIGGAALQWDLH